jgi:hypothetical protein
MDRTLKVKLFEEIRRGPCRRRDDQWAGEEVRSTSENGTAGDRQRHSAGTKALRKAAAEVGATTSFDWATDSFRIRRGNINQGEQLKEHTVDIAQQDHRVLLRNSSGV